ncbi:hypothetical protein HCN44_009094 [Aphidius gifuensis]|uniref:Cystathionine beta-synthase n=1 Tax=Aphidius gifuensis TaxID=684658 RepID=A0A834XN15_APHGI|nr:cystathionine beta-synthase [Aphidius gifuensis]KAF7990105.1 hypothetical protein HCN44_009094 [Aphidius gifuensis]
MEIRPPNSASRCTWQTKSNDSPHFKRDVLNDRKKVLPDILEAIGQTPLIRLNRIPKFYGVKCEIFVKCEFLNPGGSVKDRIGYRMVQDAESAGILKPGSTIIEPTSGNTGIGLAMAAAVRGYKCIIVMPQKMSDEKLYTLKVLGAEIIRTPTEAAWDSPDSHLGVANRLLEEIPDSVILNQYINPGNPLAHYDQTAIEIWQQTDGKLDYFVAGAGTGGTISGIGRKLKELSPRTQVVAVDPFGSILARPEELNKTKTTYYDVEGVGYDFIPTVLDHRVIDTWVKNDDCEAFKMARLLIKEEGLLCGGSSGAAVISALKFAKDLPANKRIVVLLPDGIRNYMTKFVSDHWMEARGFMEPPAPKEANKWWWNLPVSSINFVKQKPLSQGATCQYALEMFNNEKYQIIPVLIGDKFTGYISVKSLMTGLINGDATNSCPADKLAVKSFSKVNFTVTIGRVSRILEKESFVVVVDENKDDKFVGIIDQKDVFNFIRNDKNKFNGI